MNFAYNLFTGIVQAGLPLAAPFSPKLKEFVQGRKETFLKLSSTIDTNDRVIWFHMASLGEFEQGVPILEEMKKLYPTHKIVVSFFSPSGYEIKKNTPLAHTVVYLPLDTAGNAKRFIDEVHPEMAFFIKYEFWPNYLQELKKRSIPTYLISGAFRKNQVFFKSYGSWMVKYLDAFDHFFVQNNISRELLGSLGYYNVTVSGDTRFDRVSLQLDQENYVEYAERFVGNKICIVAGSTWPEDEELLEELINISSKNVKFILAPHQINAAQIERFTARLGKNVVLYSDKDVKDPVKFEVLIIDNVGLLSKIYSYAHIAYVGGAAGKTGLHNILEPATFGVPIIIGANFDNFPEARALQALKGLYSVANREELCKLVSRFLEDEDFRKKTGRIAGHYIKTNTGATHLVASFLKQNLKNG